MFYIPKEVAYNKELSIQTKFFYGYLVDCGVGDFTWSTNQMMADDCNVKVRTIQVWIRELLESGLIEVHYDNEHIKRFLRSKTNVRIITPRILPYNLNVILELDDSVEDLTLEGIK